MTKDEALELALNALHTKGEHHPRVYEAIAAIQTVLKQPVQEPIAWLYLEGLEALQAGKCWTAYPKKHEDCNTPLYTASPQRPWVGLTEFQFAEIYNKWNDSNGSTPWGLYHAIEKALKAKNHG